MGDFWNPGRITESLRLDTNEVIKSSHPSVTTVPTKPHPQKQWSCSDVGMSYEQD